MNLLPCSQPCRHQHDGYCTVEGTQPIEQIGGTCPYFVDIRDALPLTKQQLNCLRQTGNTNQLDFRFKV